MGEREKDTFFFLLCQAKDALKPVPSIGKNCGEFYSKKEKNRFSARNRIGADLHSSFSGGLLVIKPDIRRSWHDHDGGVLGCCLK